MDSYQLRRRFAGCVGMEDKYVRRRSIFPSIVSSGEKQKKKEKENVEKYLRRNFDSSDDQHVYCFDGQAVIGKSVCSTRAGGGGNGGRGAKCSS